MASPLRGFGLALVCPSAPKGLPQPSASVLGFCYKFSSCSRTEYGGYRPNGLYASVAAGLLLSFNRRSIRYLFDSCLRTFYAG